MDIRVFATGMAIWAMFITFLIGVFTDAWEPFVGAGVVFILVIIPLWVITVLDDIRGY